MINTKIMSSVKIMADAVFIFMFIDPGEMRRYVLLPQTDNFLPDIRLQIDKRRINTLDDGSTKER
jgi:hypothetical protein